MYHLAGLVGAPAFTIKKQDDAYETKGSIKFLNVKQIVDAEGREHEVNLRRPTVKKSEGKQISMALLKLLLIPEAGRFRSGSPDQEAGDIFFVQSILDEVQFL